MSGAARTSMSRASHAGERFVAASQNMAGALAQALPPGSQSDPGAALLELLGFTDAVTASRPARPFEPLAFPALFHLAERRAAATAASRP